ncbi:MAG: LysE family transporter [Sulfitobacter sp.]
MNTDVLPALILFAFVRTVPHMVGISLGFLVLMALTGLGLVQVFELFPISYIVLKVLCVFYMIWLARKIAHAAPVEKRSDAGKPMTFLQAAGFQWVNPKAWAMALTANTVYVGDSGLGMLGVAAVIFSIVNLPSVGVWTILGQQMARFLTNPARLRAFN